VVLPEDIPPGEAEIVVLVQEAVGDGNAASRESARPIWEVFGEVMADLPEEELAKLPPDGAEQHDHYIYGARK